MTYVHQGRQFILVAAGANQQTGTGAQLVAYALPVPGGRGGGRGARGGAGAAAAEPGAEPGPAPAGAPAAGARGQRGQQ